VLYLRTQVQASAKEQFCHRPELNQELLEAVPDFQVLRQLRLEVFSRNELLIFRIFQVLFRQLLQVKRDI